MNRHQNSLKDSFVISAKEHASKICVAGLGISMPCSLLYSRIPLKLAGLYIATLTIFAIMRLSYGLKGLVAQTTTSYSQLYEGDSQGTYTYSQMLFNCWEWKTDNLVDQSSLRIATKNMLMTQVNEQKLQKILKNRSKDEWFWLKLRRFVLTIVYFITLGISSYIIIWTN